MSARPITVVGAGIVGLWQALLLARAGHAVRLVEASSDPFAAGASRHAGAMLAPDCEAEAAPDLVRTLGHEGLALWRRVFPGVIGAGSLVVAAARDRSELARLGGLTRRNRVLTGNEIAALEPDLAGRFEAALFFLDEAHVSAPDALAFLLKAASEAGADVALGTAWREEAAGDAMVIDCRGLAARNELPTLRGVRGERLLLATGEIRLSRPVRLLHPRHPIYAVPRGGGQVLIGATMIESENDAAITVRSALELLGAAYALHPAFGEAEIVEQGAGVRPAFPDNVPRVIVRGQGRRIFVNGAYRHGFLLAPVLAEAVTGWIATGAAHPLIVHE